MLDHPVRGCFTEPLSVLVDNRFLVVIRFCVVDESFAVALDLSEGGVFAIVEFILSVGISMLVENSVGRSEVTVSATAAATAAATAGLLLVG